MQDSANILNTSEQIALCVSCTTYEVDCKYFESSNTRRWNIGPLGSDHMVLNGTPFHGF